MCKGGNGHTPPCSSPLIEDLGCMHGLWGQRSPYVCTCTWPPRMNHWQPWRLGIARGGARTHDHKVKSLALCRLSYPGMDWGSLQARSRHKLIVMDCSHVLESREGLSHPQALQGYGCISGPPWPIRECWLKGFSACIHKLPPDLCEPHNPAVDRNGALQCNLATVEIWGGMGLHCLPERDGARKASSREYV